MKVTGEARAADPADQRDARRRHAVLRRLEVRRLFGKSALIEGVGGTTHAGSLFGVACTDNAIAAYLADGTLPARVGGRPVGQAVPAVPQPDPN